VKGLFLPAPHKGAIWFETVISQWFQDGFGALNHHQTITNKKSKANFRTPAQFFAIGVEGII